MVEATRVNSYPVVNCLIAHNVDLNVENDAHVAVSLRPITYAAGYYNVTMFKLLVEAGAKLSWPDRHGGNLFDGCLCDIIQNKDTELLKYALGYKASANASNCQGDYCRHPMAMAAGQNDLETLKLLVRHGGDVNYQDPYGTSTLIVAIRNGSLELVRFILANGGDPQKPGTNGDAIDQKLPLAYAKELGNDAIAAELLKYGAKE
ncbi:MAG: ankyrin repeat domain-containing protein [Desulfovibrio sp.]|nr:ankyrin repeat domain-containing protein [Desulfovibrio sp.]